jgi:hypothetical protein
VGTCTSPLRPSLSIGPATTCVPCPPCGERLWETRVVPSPSTFPQPRGELHNLSPRCPHRLSTPLPDAGTGSAQRCQALFPSFPSAVRCKEEDQRRGLGVSPASGGRAARAVGNDTTVANGVEPPARPGSRRSRRRGCAPASRPCGHASLTRRRSRSSPAPSSTRREFICPCRTRTLVPLTFVPLFYARSESRSSPTRRRNAGSAAMSSSTLATEWMTVEWSRPPNSLPISTSARSNISLIRYIAT